MEEFQDALHSLDGIVRLVIAQFTSGWFVVQVGLIVLALAVSAGAGALLRRRIGIFELTASWPFYPRVIVRALVHNLGAVIFIAVLGALHAAMQALTWPSRSYLLGVGISLTTAWIVIALATSVIANHFVNRIVAISAWTLAALSIVDLLGPAMTALDSVGVVVGGLRITPLLVLKTTALLLIALWAATGAGNFLEGRLRGVTDLTPSIQVLISKLIRLSLVTAAILMVLSSVGIDLSALALFSGAVGVGIGFGLQKIVSNLVSGIILLADKSIKPGDVISVGESFGWIGTMGARYTSVVTRDGREYLIPNEDFVTQQVVNWSYSDRKVRLEVPFGVSYLADPHKVRAVALEAAAAVPRVLKSPEPVCHLTRFGDSSVDFVLRYWIDDPVEGLVNIRGAVMLALWDAFKREGIEIPYPQRDVHMKSPVHVVIDQPAGKGD